jgi:hypothetical protein
MLKVFLRRAASPTRARLTWLAALAACAWMAWVPAQAAETAAPEQAAATPFKQYQGWRDEPLDDWRKANERVGEIGGWRTYLRESQQDGDGSDGGQGQSGHPVH